MTTASQEIGNRFNQASAVPAGPENMQHNAEMQSVPAAVTKQAEVEKNAPTSAPGSPPGSPPVLRQHNSIQPCDPALSQSQPTKGGVSSAQGGSVAHQLQIRHPIKLLDPTATTPTIATPADAAQNDDPGPAASPVTLPKGPGFRAASSPGEAVAWGSDAGADSDRVATAAVKDTTEGPSRKRERSPSPSPASTKVSLDVPRTQNASPESQAETSHAPGATAEDASARGQKDPAAAADLATESDWHAILARYPSDLQTDELLKRMRHDLKHPPLLRPDPPMPPFAQVDHYVRYSVHAPRLNAPSGPRYPAHLTSNQIRQMSMGKRLRQVTPTTNAPLPQVAWQRRPSQQDASLPAVEPPLKAAKVVSHSESRVLKTQGRAPASAVPPLTAALTRTAPAAPSQPVRTAAPSATPRPFPGITASDLSAPRVGSTATCGAPPSAQPPASRPIVATSNPPLLSLSGRIAAAAAQSFNVQARKPSPGCASGLTAPPPFAPSSTRDPTQHTSVRDPILRTTSATPAASIASEDRGPSKVSAPRAAPAAVVADAAPAKPAAAPPPVRMCSICGKHPTKKYPTAIKAPSYCVKCDQAKYTGIPLGLRVMDLRLAMADMPEDWTVPALLERALQRKEAAAERAASKGTHADNDAAACVARALEGAEASQAATPATTTRASSPGPAETDDRLGELAALLDGDPAGAPSDDDERATRAVDAGAAGISEDGGEIVIRRCGICQGEFAQSTNETKAFHCGRCEALRGRAKQAGYDLSELKTAVQSLHVIPSDEPSVKEIRKSISRMLLGMPPKSNDDRRRRARS